MKNTLNHNYLLCQDWKRELSFFAEELEVFRSRLGEVAMKNTSNEILAQVEHFENKFRVMSNSFDEIKHDINLKLDQINSQAIAQPKYINVKMNETDANIVEMMDYTSADFYATKKEFYKFLSIVF
jgi:hypothetical protein